MNAGFGYPMRLGVAFRVAVAVAVGDGTDGIDETLDRVGDLAEMVSSSADI